MYGWREPKSSEIKSDDNAHAQNVSRTQVTTYYYFIILVTQGNNGNDLTWPHECLKVLIRLQFCDNWRHNVAMVLKQKKIKKIQFKFVVWAEGDRF